MPLSRRHFLAASLTLTTWSLYAANPAKRSPVILSAGWDEEETWCAGNLSRPSAKLPGRGHVLIPDPNRFGEAIVVARRPGYYLARIDWRRGRLLQHFELEDERNLVGHAVFSHDGKQLITAETDERNGVGRLVVRDARNFKRLEDRPSHGVGPHEILWLDRHTLAVANGGILTLPETGRYKRNIGRMNPSLVLIDSRDGGLLKEYRLPDNKLSIRHLDVTADGTLGAALQNEGSNLSPVLAILRDGQFGYADTPPDLCQAMQGYAASLAALGDRFLMPCPTGNLLTEWSSTGQPTAQLPLPRVFGAASLDGNWLASGEGGEIWHLQSGNLKLQMVERYPHHWDNHLTVISGAQ
ncbi:DUF1513 domain-containing protein [Chitinimonas sp. BJB300]|uniref:DUF1513 domain-containing protein n=1 Tax=Chitinimonas sp. BJB300 TaxID=1559339 RepID=UPI000C0C7A6A|nr:DUF1513 domain-containing protein [Chitinimonas sp. BJB300]PHV12820.1 hypothetical protein CSQ89_03680 [Chitinimonas sp. BJB300]TSJ88055.1 DUF1513 domain-containing protein [Chitinimonas sp. BJB300]